MFDHKPLPEPVITEFINSYTCSNEHRRDQSKQKYYTDSEQY